MKSLYNKVFKNYQVNLGMPFQVKLPLNMQTVQKAVHNEEIAASADTPENAMARAREEAALIIREAELESARMIEDILAEANEKVIEISEEARKEGYESGLGEGRKQYENLIREAEAIKENAKAEYQEILTGIEQDAVHMILEIAKKVIGEEVRLNKENLLNLVKEAFERCANRDMIILKVSSEDFDYLNENKENLLCLVEGIGELELKKDFSLKSGACVVETSFGNLDAGVQTKLRKIEEAFKEVVGR